jgi:hypothetical protein
VFIPHCSDWLSLIVNNSLLIKVLQKDGKARPSKRWWASLIQELSINKCSISQDFIDDIYLESI